MKLLAFASLCGLSLASFEQMQADLQAITNRYVRGLIETGASNRNIPDILQDNLEKINEYGCWCYFLGDHGRGKGKPVDAIDRFCRKLAMGYDCAMMDIIAQTGNDTCVPWEESYISGIGGGEPALVATCDAFNTPTDGCSNYACKVEGIFVLKVFNLFISGDSTNEDFKHNNGFDEKAGCPINECKIENPEKCDVNRECCGVHPDRFPFKPMGGDRACCEGIAYDASILSCCPDGTPRLSC